MSPCRSRPAAGHGDAHCHAFQSLRDSATTSISWAGAIAVLIRLGAARPPSAPGPPGRRVRVRGDALQRRDECGFFYIHDAGNENADGGDRGARAVGIRLVLARGMYDGRATARYRERPADADRRARADRAASSDATVTVQPAPAQPARRLAGDAARGFEVPRPRTRCSTSTWRRAATRVSARCASTAPRRCAISIGSAPGPAHHRRALRVARRRGDRLMASGAPPSPTARAANVPRRRHHGLPELPAGGRAGGARQRTAATNNRLSSSRRCAWPRCWRACGCSTGAPPGRRHRVQAGTALPRLDPGPRDGHRGAGRAGRSRRRGPDTPVAAPTDGPRESVVYALSPQAVTDVWVHGERLVSRGRLARTCRTISWPR